jgi:meckelin
MTLSGTTASCNCNAKYSKVGQSAIGAQTCLLTSLASEYISLEEQASLVHFSSLSSRVISSTFRHYFVWAATNCKYYGGSVEDQAACQTLANLCVLQLYDNAAVVCATFISILTVNRVGANSVNGVQGWGVGMPWLYYEVGTAPCKAKSVVAKMSLDSMLLEFIVAKYTMNGTFVGYEDVNTLLSFCPRAAPKSSRGGGTSSSTHWMIFGTSEYDTYKCDLSLLIQREQFFYDMFLVDPSSSDLVPVSVRVTNLKFDGSSPNPLERSGRDLCTSKEVAVRRFFLYDVLSGLTDASFQQQWADGFNAPVAVRYASSIIMDIRIRDDDPESIYDPVMTIQYKDMSTNGWTSEGSPNAHTEASFKARYSMDPSAFFKTLNGFFIAGLVLAGLLFLLRYSNWRLRCTRPMAAVVANGQTQGLTLAVLVELAILAAHSFVCIFFPFTVLVAFYWFTFFKIQDTVAVMLPLMENIYATTSDYYPFVSVLQLLFFFQLGYVLHMTYRQAMADIFFVDWEPAKTKTKRGEGTVSVWRTILVANEWNEMQSVRRTDIRFSLFWIMFFLLGMNYEFNATQQPSLDDLSRGKLNVVLRFASTTWWWCVLSAVQLLWKFFIYERYISEPPEQKYVDMCTIAKVSVIVLDEPYHGYYLHCRSPHQYADGNMAELVGMLRSEENGLTVDRSLEGAPKDVQSFEVFFTGEWRNRYDKICAGIMTNEQFDIWSVWTSGWNSSGGAGTVKRGAYPGANTSSSNTSEGTMKSWLELNGFLQSFIENRFNVPDLRRAHREPEYSEKLLKIPPDLRASGQPCVFYPDEDFEFSRVLFLGRELDLLLLNILAYSVFDLWLDNTAISALMCYALDLVICQVREDIGQVRLVIFIVLFLSLILCYGLGYHC